MSLLFSLAKVERKLELYSAQTETVIYKNKAYQFHRNFATNAKFTKYLVIFWLFL